MIEEKKIKIDQAENLLRQGKYQEAIDLCEGIHLEYPDEESVMLMLSWAYYDSGKTGEAGKYLNELLERELKRKIFTGFAFDELVRIYKQTKDFKKLVEICERAVAAQPLDVGLLTELGTAYLQSGDPRRASAIYEKLIQMENDNPVYYCYLGEALFAAGFYEESERAYRMAGEIDSDKTDYYFFKMASLFQSAGSHKEAERLLNECIAVDSSNPHYYCSLGDSRVGLGQIKDAGDAYEQAIRCDHSGAASYYNRFGNSLLKSGNFLQAAQAFSAAINYEPARPYFLGLASALKGMGLVDQAAMILCEADGTRQH